MFSLMFQKLLHKKWMVICLLIGNILLIAVAVSHPMYRTSSFQRMLTDEFKAYEEAKNDWPTVFCMVYRKSGKTEGTSVETVKYYMEAANEQFDVPLLYKTRFITLNELQISPVIARDETIGRSVRIASMTGIRDHIELVSGRYPQDGLTDDGVIEVAVSQVAERVQDLLLGEEYNVDKFTDLDGNPYKIRIVGIFKKINEDEEYWPGSAASLNKEGFVSEKTFDELFLETKEKQDYYAYSLTWHCVWDYTKIRPQDVKHIVRTTHDIQNNPNYGRTVQDNKYEAILEDYSAKAKKVEASLLILQIPAMLLLCAFLYMISGQMLSMEQNEISLMKSRGAKRYQIIGLYFMQSFFLGVISLFAALPLGRVICNVLGSASNFLEFSAKRQLEVKYSTDILFYAGGALLAGIIMTVIPVIGYSKVGIVNLKQGKHRAKRSFWKVSFLDVICLAVSLYGYYNFMRNKENIMQDILAGESLDPMIYFSSSLFILGAGLFLLRIQPLLIKVVFAIRKKNLRPGIYASLLETIRSGKKQEFIMIFMIMTVALGIFNATVARTIVENAEQNAKYVNGTDIVLKEQWSDNSYAMQTDPTVEFKYIEPDFNKYGTIEGVDGLTKVLHKTTNVSSGKVRANADVLGIVPSEFAVQTEIADGLNQYDYYDYLNVLASVENGALVSENFMTKLGLSIGDSVSFSDSHFGKVVVRICGFFSYWPTYEPTVYVQNKDGSMGKADQYMVVANLTYLEKQWGPTPYEVWMKSDDTKGIYDFVEANTKLRLTRFSDLDEIEDETLTDTLFQGTNGILTMSFIVVLILCAVGYLIYWIMSIRSRELLFGVLRAMGMKKREITGMLVVEQICSGVFSIVAGAGVGLMASKLYVPLVQSAYAADNQVLPLRLITSQDDMIKLFAVIFAVMLVCLVIIARIVSRMNISNALKLGED